MVDNLKISLHNVRIFRLLANSMTICHVFFINWFVFQYLKRDLLCIGFKRVLAEVKSGIKARLQVRGVAWGWLLALWTLWGVDLMGNQHPIFVVMCKHGIGAWYPNLLVQHTAKPLMPTHRTYRYRTLCF